MNFQVSQQYVRDLGVGERLWCGTATLTVVFHFLLSPSRCVEASLAYLLLGAARLAFIAQ